MPIKKQWDPLWVIDKATKEKICIKSYKFNPELHAKIEGEEEVVEEAAPEVEEGKEEGPSKKELQEKYVEKFGKKPFNGWGVEKLQEKLEG